MTQYSLRADYKEGDQALLSAWLSAIATVFLVVYEEHDGENPHVHCVFSSDKNLSAVRVSFKRKFTDKVGNGGYSLKECDENVDAYMRYMCKGDSKDNDPVVLIHQGQDYTEEKVKAAHDAYWVNNAALSENKKKRKAIPNCSTVIEKLEFVCKEKGVRKNDKQAIAAEYIKMMKDARKPINVFAAKAVVNTVCVLLDDSGEAAETLASIIAA